MILRTTHTRALAAVWLALSALSCATHSARRTYDYAEIPSDLPVECRVEEPAAHCKALHLPTKCRVPIPPSDDCGASYGTSAADSRACTTSALLQSVAKGAGGLSESDRVACFAHEAHKSQADAGDGGPRPHDGFDLHVVEFDDEGRPWNADRIDLTLQRLKEDLERPSVVVTFVHGWKNDADVCNGNLSCFRDVLEILAKLEKSYERITTRKARRVIGIYIGWRGGSITLPGVKQLTFWGRKHTAHTIGDNGAVTALIGRIRTIVNNSSPQKGGAPNTTAVSIGHSFGAALLFSALEGVLNRQVGEALQEAYGPTVAGDAASREARSLRAQAREASLSQALVAPNRCVHVKNTGDLVVLVNPAMEASRFANLNQASHLCYEPGQMPVLLTLGSEADSAVGFFFPIGQSFSTLFRAARSRPAWLSMAEGFGMYKSYLTHRLALKQAPTPPEVQKTSDQCKCPSRLSDFGDDLVRRLEAYYRHIAQDPPPRERIRLAEYREFLYSRLEPARDVDANNPFLMVEVDRKMVGGHSDIFNVQFMDFLIEFVVQTEMKREGYGDYRAPRAE